MIRSTLILIILSSSLLSGCSSDVSKEIIGEWKGEVVQQTLTFYEDGYVDMDSPRHSTYEGTYTIDDTLYFRGFWGGGNLIVQGNRNETNASTKHTTQQVFINAGALAGKYYVMVFAYLLPLMSLGLGFRWVVV